MQQRSNKDTSEKAKNPLPLDQDLVTVLSAMPLGLLVIDEHGTVRYANAAAEETFGCPRSELTGAFLGSILCDVADSAAPDGPAEMELGPAGVTRTDGWDALCRSKGGTSNPCRVSFVEIPGGAGAILVMLQPQTPRGERPAVNELLVRALHQHPDPMLIATRNGKVVYANAAFERLATGNRSDSADPLSNADHAAWRTAERDLGGHLERLLASERIEGQPLIDRLHPHAHSEYIAPIRDDSEVTTHFLLLGHAPVPEFDATLRELEQSEQRFRKVAEMAGEWLWEQNPQGCYLYSSAAVSSILGYRPEDMAGKNYLELLTPEDRAHWIDALPHAPNIPKPFHRLTNRYVHRDGHEVFTESSGEPLLDANGEILKWWGVDHDITARKRTEDALRLRDRAMAAAEVGISILDARRPGYPLIYANPAFCSLTGYSEDELLGRPPMILGEPERDTKPWESLDAAMRAGTSRTVSAELCRRDGSHFWGDMTVSAVTDETGRTTHFIWLVTDVTERRSAVEAQRELETARRIQASLLPKATLRTAGIEAAGIFLPAGEIGGDYFDYFVTPDGVNLTIADVSGHNVGAALIMTETRSALRATTMAARAAGQRLGASKMLTDLNQLLFEDLNGADLFITMQFLEYDRVTRRLTYANAGHNPGLVMRPDAAHCTQLDAEGLVLGVHPEVRFEEKSLLLKPGDVVLLYTDGVIEARDPKGELFGIDRLSAQLKTHQHLPAEDLIRQIVDSVKMFATPAGMQDDTSMVALKIL